MDTWQGSWKSSIDANVFLGAPGKRLAELPAAPLRIGILRFALNDNP
jgi:hypothetical protein